MTSPKAGWILLGGGVVRGEGAPVVGVEPPVRKLLLGDLAIPAPPTPPPARPHAPPLDQQTGEAGTGRPGCCVSSCDCARSREACLRRHRPRECTCRNRINRDKRKSIEQPTIFHTNTHWFLSISRMARSKSSLLKPASSSTASNLPLRRRAA